MHLILKTILANNEVLLFSYRLVFSAELEGNMRVFAKLLNHRTMFYRFDAATRSHECIKKKTRLGRQQDLWTLATFKCISTTWIGVCLKRFIFCLCI